MRLHLKTVFATIALPLLLLSCGSHDDSQSEIDEKENAGDSNLIHLEPDQAEALGVATDTLRYSAFNEAIEYSGEIVLSPNSMATVTAPNSGQVFFARGIAEGVSVSQGNRIATVSADNMAGGDINTANANALRTAKAELDRMKPLLELGIVTAQDYAATELNYRQALNAAKNSGESGLTASSPISGTVSSLLVQNGQYAEAGQPIAEIVNPDGMRLRVDVPARDIPTAVTSSKAFFKSNSSDELAEARRTGDVVTAAVTNGYAPIYYNVNPASAVPGFVRVYLELDSSDALNVPVEAIVERLGNYFVYVILSEDHYERRAVTLGRKGAGKVEILSGLLPGDCYVSRGASFVRMAETAGVAPEGHHHH